MNRGLISRIKEDNSSENLTFDVRKVIKGEEDIPLRKEDEVTIRSIFDLREAPTIAISGEVLKPNTFAYQENMTLSDLIMKAGGFREEADLSLVEVTRRLTYEEAKKLTDKLNTIYRFALSRDLRLSPADAAFKLRPFDEVVVRRAPGFRDQGSIIISGEVLYSGSYTLKNKNEHISDAIKRAGGLTPEAFPEGATLTRVNNLSAAEKEKRTELMKRDSALIKDPRFTEKTSYSIGIELKNIIAHPGTGIDLLLQPGDVITIPKEMQTVKVSGSVMNPIALTYEKHLTLRQYINRAGGYDEKARTSRTYVIYPNGTTATTSWLLFRNSPRITPGSEIIVPKKPEKKGNDNAMKWISMASGLSSISIALITLVNLVK
jgi:protein involved in polysaccharide export with SLBB domain